MTNEEIIAKIRLFADEQRNLLTDFESNSNFRKGEITAYSAIIAFLSELEKSLPAKVMAGEELENELVRFYLKDLCASEDDELTDATRHHHFPIMWDDLRDIARHFYELGCRNTAEKYDEIEYNRQRAEESPLPEDTVLFNNGVEEGKRLMMEEAVEGEVMLNPYPTICLDDCKDYDFKDGDKVRVIIVKKED